MASRLTDTNIWKKQKWFKKLSVEYKLCWKYLTDECNHVGIWKIDISELLDDLGVDEFDLTEFINQCNSDFDKKTGKGVLRKRIIMIDEDHIWLTGFMTFQYAGKNGVINHKNNTVPKALELLKSFNLYELGIENKYFKIDTSPFKPLQAPSSPLKEVEARKVKVEVEVLSNTEEDLYANTKPLENTLCFDMIETFKKINPHYFSVSKTDLPACLQIAYHIAEIKKWNKKSVINENKDKVVGIWKSVIEFTKDHSLYSNFSIDGIEKKWAGVLQSMSQSQKKLKTATKKFVM